MADVLYPTIIEDIDTWVTDTWKWMILQAPFSPAPSQVFVADIVADEVTVVGYLRVTASTKVIDTTHQFPSYMMDNPDFGTPMGAQVGTWLVLYREVTTDADSVLAAAWLINWDFTAGAPLVFSFLDYPGPPIGADSWLLTGQGAHPIVINRDPA